MMDAMTTTPRKSSKRKASKPVKRAKKPQRPSRKSAKATKPARKANKPQKSLKASPKFRSPYSRAASNPFRAGSSYAVAYDILAAHPEGLPRQQLIEKLAKVTKKPVKNAGYDAAVVLSARSNSRHQSCRSGFIVAREHDNVQLEVTATATASAAAGK